MAKVPATANKEITVDSPIVKQALKEVSEISSVEIIRVHNKTEMLVVEGHIQTAKQKLKELTALEKTITKPLDEAKKAVKALFSTPIDSLKELESKGKLAILAYNDALEKKRRKAEEELRQKMLEEAQANGGVTEDVIDAIEDKIVAKPQAVEHLETSHVRTGYDFEIVDESLIPREFLKVDEVKIRKYLTAMKESAKIDGVRFFQTKTLSVRA